GVIDRIRGRLAEFGSKFRLDGDDDGDGLPNLLEAAVGLNPKSRDSNGNGVPDGDEDWDGDGVTNVVEFGLVTDPGKIIAHYGATDPEWVGFQQPVNRPFVGKATVPEPSTGPSWNVPSTGQSMYSLTLTNAQRSEAMQNGWRMMTRGRIRAGIALSSVDMTPDGPRFDMNFIRGSSAV